MIDFSAGIQNISDGQGIAIAVTGMLIVFAALTIISISIALLPKFLQLLARILPEEHHHAAPSANKQKESKKEKDDALLAAIGFGLYKNSLKEVVKD